MEHCVSRLASWPGFGSVVLQQSAEVIGDRLRFVVELVPGETGDRVAGGGKSPVAGAIFAEGRAGAVALPAIQLDDAAVAGPVAVDPVALGAEDDPVVEAG
jgi:hypothetical protein